MAHSFTIGERYRDARDPSEDEFRTWIKGPLEKGISALGGIRVLKGQSPPTEDEITCVVVFSSDIDRSDAENEWEDEFDLAHGQIKYWGDAKQTDEAEIPDPDDFTGNQQLREVHRKDRDDLRGSYPPILVFRKRESGYVEFYGLAVIEHIELSEFDSNGKMVPNYLFHLAVLDVEEVPLEWIHERTQTGSDRQAPEPWARWVETGEVTPDIRYGSTPGESTGDTDVSEIDFEEGNTAGTERISERREVRVSQNFKDRVYEAYDRRCAVTGINHRELLTVTHILSRSEYPELAEDIGNVALMNWTHHFAFDADIYTFDTDFRLWIDPDFETDNTWLQKTLIERQGEVISAVEDTLNTEYLERRNEELAWWPP